MDITDHDKIIKVSVTKKQKTKNNEAVMIKFILLQRLGVNKKLNTQTLACTHTNT